MKKIIKYQMIKGKLKEFEVAEKFGTIVKPNGCYLHYNTERFLFDNPKHYPVGTEITFLSMNQYNECRELTTIKVIRITPTGRYRMCNGTIYSDNELRLRISDYKEYRDKWDDIAKYDKAIYNIRDNLHKLKIVSFDSTQDALEASRCIKKAVSLNQS